MPPVVYDLLYQKACDMGMIIVFPKPQFLASCQMKTLP